MSRTPHAVQLSPGQTELAIHDTPVFRGVLPSRFRLDVQGYLKLGAFSDLAPDTQCTVRREDDGTAGSLVLTDRFVVPSSGIFRAEQRIFFYAEKFNPSGHIFDRLRFISPGIEAPFLEVRDEAGRVPIDLLADEKLWDRFPVPLPGSEIIISELRGPRGSCVGFSKIWADRIADFPGTRGWGIVTDYMNTKFLSDTLLRCARAQIGTMYGELEFLAIDADPHPTPPDQMPWVRTENPSLVTVRVTAEQNTVGGELAGVGMGLGTGASDFDGVLLPDASDLDKAGPGTPTEGSQFSTRTHVQAQRLIALEHSATKVVMRNGDLKLEQLELGPISVEIENGYLSIGTIIPSPTSNDGRTVLRADKITLHEFPDRSLLERVDLHGAVYLGGTRIRWLEK